MPLLGRGMAWAWVVGWQVPVVALTDGQRGVSGWDVR